MLMEVTRGTGPFAFFVRRWRRQVPLGLLFWRDMIVVGSVLNLAFAFAGLMALGFKAGPAVAIAVFHAPLPYNLFLFGAVWRTAELTDAAKASSARLGAVAWLVATMVI
jgi:hypothetical protein